MMNHKCNISSRGKTIRMVIGYIFLLVALGLGLAAWLLARYWLWYPMVGCFLAGAVMVYEAANGWCALRAMGIKTPL